MEQLILSDYSRKELEKLRKNFIKRIYWMILFALVSLFITYIIANNFITILGLCINFLIICLQIFIFTKLYKAIGYIIFDTIAVLYVEFNILVFSFIPLNKMFLQFDFKTNIIYFIVLLHFIFIGYFFEKSRFSEYFDYFRNSKKIDFEICRVEFDFWVIPKKNYNSFSKWVMKVGFIGIYTTVIIVSNIIYFRLKNIIDLSMYSRKSFIANILSIFVVALLFIYIGNMLYRFIFIKKWEKTNKRTLYTKFYDYLVSKNKIKKNIINEV